MKQAVPKLDPEAMAKLEEAIKGTVLGIRKLLGSQVTRRTICLLIHDAMPNSVRVPVGSIMAVVEAMENLEKVHFKKKV